MALLKLFQMCLKVKKIAYKMCTKILFHCSNINTDSPLSSNRVKVEKKHFRNLSFHSTPCRWLAGLKTSNPLTNATSRKTFILKVDIVINIFNACCYTYTLCIVEVVSVEHFEKQWLQLTVSCTENRKLLVLQMCFQNHIIDHYSTKTVNPRIFFVALWPNAGHDLLILEVSRSHTTTHHSR
jgi:hypothetical protein